MINIEKFKINNLGITKKILLFSDLHLNWFSRDGIEEKISEIIDRDKIDFVVIAGDVTNWSKEKNRVRFEKFLRAINSKPIFIGIGNHDLGLFGKNGRKYFSKLSRINNVFTLDNQSMIIDGIEIIGFSPRKKAYDRGNINTAGVDIFVKDWQKSKIKLQKNKSRILICHDPMVVSLVADSGKLPELFTEKTLVLSGHNHNGSFPLWVEKIMKKIIKDFGIIPEAPFVIKKSRGKHKIGKSELVITKGIHRYYFLPSVACVTEINTK